ncbi:MAG TPA: phosphoribosylformylglycinamidine synthase subunit PurL [Phycisphaerae bacterium]|nr:phosphoribosylformylglycinamidine synthase subunit PurL [Phycisphaerae bacterium]
MAVYRIEVHPRDASDDPAGAAVLSEIRQLGMGDVHSVRTARVFLLQAADGILNDQKIQTLARGLLADPVTERPVIGHEKVGSGRLVEVHLKPGVMDPVAASTELAIGDLLDLPRAHSDQPAQQQVQVRTGRRYVLSGHLTADAAALIARRLLSNESIEEVYFEAFTPAEFPRGRPYEFERVQIPIRDLNAGQLQTLSRQGHLFLDLTEMQAVQNYFRTLGRDPTDAELETLAQTWSEHCVHKTLKAHVEFSQQSFNQTPATGGAAEVIDNLVKSTIFRATSELACPWTLSVFKDNAGVIALDDKWAVCMKVETHNRPSAIEPYGGAATGIGGCIRDVMGTGGGAKPVASTDIFCFADPNTPMNQVPKGVIHPRRIAQRVVAGVRDYGNRMGIPTVNGAVYFDQRFIGNPLVFCGTVGLLPRGLAAKRSARAGDRIILIGGRTGRDGIHGATFSSDVITEKHGDEFSHAVQIGNAITEKKMLDVLLEARDYPGGPLYNAITDCGAGGLSSAVGEMGSETGATVELDRVGLKYQGLSYSEIWISEAQERMVLSVEPRHVKTLLDLAAAEDVEAVDIGVFDGSGKLTLHYQGHTVGSMDMKFIHDGLPRPTRRAVWQAPVLPPANVAPPSDYATVLIELLGSPGIASKHWIIRQYDHEVQGATVVKPLVGPGGDGPGDASVIAPIPGSRHGIALAVGCQPRFGDIDPYQMALNGIDEAIRNIVCVGGNPEYTALLDNFCWPKCTDPTHLGALVRACQACYDGAMAFRTPFISGKDSLSNEFFTEDGKRICIPYTLLISAISVLGDAGHCITMDAKTPGNHLLIVGGTDHELGGSYYYALRGQLGPDVPKVDLNLAPQVHKKVAEIISHGWAAAAHDLSEGGLAVALSEMLFAGRLGASIDLAGVPYTPAAATDDVLLFSESATRYLLEIKAEHYDEAIRALRGLQFGVLGKLTEKPNLVIRSQNGGTLMNEPVERFRQAWLKPLDW